MMAGRYEVENYFLLRNVILIPHFCLIYVIGTTIVVIIHLRLFVYFFLSHRKPQ